ncbi:DUF2585 family protein [Candidatus Riflebacteria bacterium]
MHQKKGKEFLPLLIIPVVLVFTGFLLLYENRTWSCACGSLYPWIGDIWSADASQHLFDPYSFTHVLHGVIFCGLLAWCLPQFSTIWRFVFAVSLEGLWEVIENSTFIIQRYREATVTLGYQGDSIINSFGDIIACGLGFTIAWHLGFRRAFILFIVIEIVLLFWIKDGLLLNILMLLYPIEGIKAWQMSH